MFGNNAFGALAMDQPGPSNTNNGPSLQQVEGEEVEVEVGHVSYILLGDPLTLQWLQLCKTNGEVYVRVQDPVDLQDLPSECHLMAISNTWDLIIVGGPSGGYSNTILNDLGDGSDFRYPDTSAE